MRIYLLITILSTLSLSASWEPLLEKEGIKVFKDAASKTATLPFKAQGLVQFSLEKVLAALTDEYNKPKWAPKLKSITIHKRDQTLKEVIFSEYYKTPWPAFDREFLMRGQVLRKSKDLIILQAKSIYNESLAHPDYVQANVSKLNLTLKRVSSNSTLLIFEFHGDMMGYIPSWLSNIIQYVRREAGS